MNSLGTIVEECLVAVPLHFNNTEIPVHSIMPNHLHAIVVLRANASTVGPAKASNMRAEAFAAPVIGSIPTIVRSFKSAVTRAARAAFRKPSLDVWQRNYFERVIRSDDEFRKTWQYICENPARWDFDPENPQKPVSISTHRLLRQYGDDCGESSSLARTRYKQDAQPSSEHAASALAIAAPKAHNRMRRRSTRDEQG